jgi:nucleotide-binding universal stress UspA family protein
VPIDNSIGATLALGVASELARLMHAELVLLRIVAPSLAWQHGEAGELLRAYINPDWHTEAIAGAQRHVDGLARQLEKEDLEAMARAVVGDLPQAIAEASVALEADLVVMGTDAYSASMRTFTGSVAHCLAEDGGVPVLLIPEASRPAAQETFVGPLMHPVLDHSPVASRG